jgi:hypothetical protein
VVNVNRKNINTQFIERIDLIVDEYVQKINTHSGEEDWDDSTYLYFLSRFEAIFDFIPDQVNPYKRNFEEAKSKVYSNSENDYHDKAPRLVAISGVIKALKQDLSHGYLVKASEILNAELFSDFLEMVEHLLEEGYKDPAAVILGSVLEEHLRKLCAKNSLPIDSTDSKGITRPKKADLLNSELTAAVIYSKLDQKSVTAWLDLRNKAAHGQYADYSKAQVELLLQSVRDFITRHPA